MVMCVFWFCNIYAQKTEKLKKTQFWCDHEAASSTEFGGFHIELSQKKFYNHNVHSLKETLIGTSITMCVSMYVSRINLATHNIHRYHSYYEDVCACIQTKPEISNRGIGNFSW
ncbi:uncharacterized protein [Musca autumnalis]|uniref:uncharacterized protein n=1 Tax=Musca autumnalis TaxID=221902 RepID=UPI003CEE6A30